MKCVLGTTRAEADILDFVFWIALCFPILNLYGLGLFALNWNVFFDDYAHSV